MDFHKHDSREARSIVSNARERSVASEPCVPWQIPAVGSAKLSPKEAERLASWLREQDADILRFLLAGAHPDDVADRLEREAEKLK